MKWRRGKVDCDRYLTDIHSLGWSMMVILCDDGHWYFDLTDRPRRLLRATNAEQARAEAEQMVRYQMTCALAEVSQ